MNTSRILTNFSLVQFILTQVTLPSISTPYFPTMSLEIIDLTVEAFLPNEIKQDWIPQDGLAVPHLFWFTKYPPQEALYFNTPNLSQLLHQEHILTLTHKL